MRKKMIMNKMARQFTALGSVCLLSCFALESSWANPGGGAGARADLRAARMQQKEERQQARQAEHEQRSEAKAEARNEGPKKVGRLTPEERRDLRRQINEAGQDLYQNSPKN